MKTKYSFLVNSENENLEIYHLDNAEHNSVTYYINKGYLSNDNFDLALSVLSFEVLKFNLEHDDLFNLCKIDYQVKSGCSLLTLTSDLKIEELSKIIPTLLNKHKADLSSLDQIKVKTRLPLYSQIKTLNREVLVSFGLDKAQVDNMTDLYYLDKITKTQVNTYINKEILGKISSLIVITNEDKNEAYKSLKDLKWTKETFVNSSQTSIPLLKDSSYQSSITIGKKDILIPLKPRKELFEGFNNKVFAIYELMKNLFISNKTSFASKSSLKKKIFEIDDSLIYQSGEKALFWVKMMMFPECKNSEIEDCLKKFQTSKGEFKIAKQAYLNNVCYSLDTLKLLELITNAKVNNLTLDQMVDLIDNLDYKTYNEFEKELSSQPRVYLTYLGGLIKC